MAICICKVPNSSCIFLRAEGVVNIPTNAFAKQISITYPELRRFSHGSLLRTHSTRFPSFESSHSRAPNEQEFLELSQIIFRRSAELREAVFRLCGSYSVSTPFSF